MVDTRWLGGGQWQGGKSGGGPAPSGPGTGDANIGARAANGCPGCVSNYSDYLPLFINGIVYSDHFLQIVTIMQSCKYRSLLIACIDERSYYFVCSL